MAFKVGFFSKPFYEASTFNKNLHSSLLYYIAVIIAAVCAEISTFIFSLWLVAHPIWFTFLAHATASFHFRCDVKLVPITVLAELRPLIFFAWDFSFFLLLKIQNEKNPSPNRFSDFLWKKMQGRIYLNRISVLNLGSNRLGSLTLFAELRWDLSWYPIVFSFCLSMRKKK